MADDWTRIELNAKLNIFTLKTVLHLTNGILFLTVIHASTMTAGLLGKIQFKSIRAYQHSTDTHFDESKCHDSAYMHSSL